LLIPFISFISSFLCVEKSPWCKRVVIAVAVLALMAGAAGAALALGKGKKPAVAEYVLIAQYECVCVRRHTHSSYPCSLPCFLPLPFIFKDASLATRSDLRFFLY
jgi:hypothetical protein